VKRPLEPPRLKKAAQNEHSLEAEGLEGLAVGRAVHVVIARTANVGVVPELLDVDKFDAVNGGQAREALIAEHVHWRVRLS
jgi:hypothetical protein